MKEAFKEAFGYEIGRFAARCLIESIGRGGHWLILWSDNPEKAKNEFKKKFLSNKNNQEKIKMGFM